MSLPPERTPVILAVGQAIERDQRVTSRDLMERAARAALDEALGLVDKIERVVAVDVLNDDHPAPATAVARRLGLADVVCETTPMGGNTPQAQVTKRAAQIAAGEAGTILLVGAEALNSAKKGGVDSDPDDDLRDAEDELEGEDRVGFSPEELAISLLNPLNIYPMFEMAMAGVACRTPVEQREFVCRFMARNTSVAAKHPYAWFPQEASPDELSTVTDRNRMISDPYTLRLNAIMAVDQGAALVLTSYATAVELGLEDQAVFVWSGADCNDVWYPVQRPDLARSPAIAAAAGGALGAAGRSIDDIDHVDLYSCFPSAVQAGAKGVGIALADPRGLTVTGGLAYFGGPGNNYVTHSIATVVQRLREGGGLGLTTGLGWYTTKHSVGVYGAEPPPDGFSVGDTTAEQAAIDRTAIESTVDAEGTATVVASTLARDREGGIKWVPVYADLPDGRRIAARSADGVAEQLSDESLVGATIRLVGSEPLTYEIESMP